MREPITQGSDVTNATVHWFREDAAEHRSVHVDRRRVARTPLTWTSDLAYAVGLMATDGGVGPGGYMAFGSKDRDLVEIMLRCLGRPISYRTIPPGRQGIFGTSRSSFCFAQFSDVRLHDWLIAIGITPRKSLTLGAIEVPDEFIFPFVRGLVDGDGSVITMMNRPGPIERPDYWVERIVTLLYSASRTHVEWVERTLARFGIRGSIHTDRRHEHPLYRLKYAKVASINLLTRLYEDSAAPRLERKWLVWEGYRARHAHELMDMRGKNFSTEQRREMGRKGRAAQTETQRRARAEGRDWRRAKSGV